MEKGDFYKLKGNSEDPFPPKEPQTIVEVKDVKDNWVLYRFTHGTTYFQNERKPIKDFLRIYEPC